MWKVLGEETVIPKMGDVWVERMVELSKRRKDKDRFIEIIREADVRYVFDAVREVNTFVVTLSPKHSHNDLEFMRAYVQRLNRSLKFPVVEYQGEEQRFSIIFTSEQDEDDYTQRKKSRKEYFDWVEKQAEVEKTKEDEQSF